MVEINDSTNPHVIAWGHDHQDHGWAEWGGPNDMVCTCKCGYTIGRLSGDNVFMGSTSKQELLDYLAVRNVVEG
jgi:hypothetical protein